MTDSTTHIEKIECSVQPFDVSFHPRREYIVASALVDGTIEVHDFEPSDEQDHDTILSSISLNQSSDDNNKTSTRAVLFSEDASHIFAGTSAGDICLLDAERACTLVTSDESSTCILSRISASQNGIHSLFQLPQEVGNHVVTGDEQGVVAVWDARLSNKTSKPVLQWKDQHSDYISGFDYHDNTLLSSCADATLGVMDLRMAMADTSKRNDAFRQSDDQEDELLSISIIKHGKKVVCGTQEGVLAVWSWGTWGDVSDRFPGHPASIDALLKVDEDTLLTGSSDGLLRLVQIHPDKLLGVLGNHDGFPIEKLQFNSTRNFVASVSHDNMIRLWDATVLQEGDDDESDSDEDIKEHQTTLKQAPAASMPTASAAAARHNSDDEWDDMDGEDSNDDDSDDSDSDDEDDFQGKKPSKRLKTENEKFFEDL